MPSFEEIWPSRGPIKRVKRGVEYYLDVSNSLWVMFNQYVTFVLKVNRWMMDYISGNGGQRVEGKGEAAGQLHHLRKTQSRDQAV